MTLPSYVVRFLLVFFFRILVVFFSLHFVSFGDSENFLGLTSSFTSCFYFHMPRSFFSFLPCSIPSQSFVLCISSKHFCKWVRLNYATTHHHPPPPTTSQNISTTSHPPHPHQPKYITTTRYNLPPAISTHRQPKYIHCYLSLPKKWTTTLQKPKYIHI